MNTQFPHPHTQEKQASVFSKKLQGADYLRKHCDILLLRMAHTKINSFSRCISRLQENIWTLGFNLDGAQQNPQAGEMSGGGNRQGGTLKDMQLFSAL